MTTSFGLGVALFQGLQPVVPIGLPKPAKEPPAGPVWIHEIKHDGFRILARRDGNNVLLYTRNGYNFADRFPWRLPRTRRREAKVVGKARPSLRSRGVRSSGDQADNRLP